MCVCVCVCVCVLETCFLGLLFLNLSFVPLSSPGACAVAAPALPFPSGLSGFGGYAPPATGWRWRKFPTAEANTKSCVQGCSNVCYARPPDRQLPLCLAASLSLSLSLSSSLCFCLSPFPSLPPSSFSFSLSTPLTQLLPPASLISRIRYSFKKTHSTWLSAQTTLTQSGKEGEGATDGGWGREREREGERVLEIQKGFAHRQTYCMNVNNCGIFTLAHACRDTDTYAQTQSDRGLICSVC